MTLKVIDTFYPTQNCLVYKGKISGKITDKNKIFLGKVAQLPTLPRNKRFNLRVRGSDAVGNRYLPVQCHARTDSAGHLYVADKHAPEIDCVSPGDQAPELTPQLLPEVSPIADAIHGIMIETTRRKH